MEKTLADALAWIIREKPANPLRRVRKLGIVLVLTSVRVIALFLVHVLSLHVLSSQLAELISPETYVEPSGDAAAQAE